MEYPVRIKKGMLSLFDADDKTGTMYHRFYHCSKVKNILAITARMYRDMVSVKTTEIDRNPFTSICIGKRVTPASLYANYILFLQSERSTLD